MSRMLEISEELENFYSAKTESSEQVIPSPG